MIKDEALPDSLTEFIVPPTSVTDCLETKSIVLHYKHWVIKPVKLIETDDNVAERQNAESDGEVDYVFRLNVVARVTAIQVRLND